MPGTSPYENLEETLKDAVQHIRSGVLQHEAQVKQSVIVPILRGLDWDDTNPREFVPEFPLANGMGRLDALCRANHDPVVFLKAKRPGSADSRVEEQRLGYTANKDIPFLIITDGNIWNFYLSTAAGVPYEQFYRMELQREEEIPAYTEFLDKHLRKSSVLTEETRRSAENLLASEQRRRQASGAIPRVWRSLLESQDEILCDRLAEGVQSDCGIRPKLDDVEEFLRTQSSSTKQQQPALVTPDFPPDRPVSHKPSSGNFIGYTFGGEAYPCKSALEVLAKVLIHFHRLDPGFMARYAPATVHQTMSPIVLVAQAPGELCGRNGDLCNSENLGIGWWMRTLPNKTSIRRYIEVACKVAGVRFGTDLTLIGKTPVPPDASREKSSIIGYVLDDRPYKYTSAIQTLVGVLKEFDRRDSGFMWHYSRKTVGKSRRLVARNPHELYENIDHEGITEDLGNGWYLGKNISSNMIRKNIQIACNVAGVQFGTDLMLIET